MTDERVIPHDLAAERAVLGAILLNPAQFEKVGEILKAGDFHRLAHRMVYAAMLETDRRRVAIDLLTVRAELERVGQLDEVGLPYLAGMTEGVPRSTNVVHYAAIVRDHAIRRRAITLAKGLTDAAYDAELPVPDLLRQVDVGVVGLQSGTGIGDLVDLKATEGALFAELEHRVSHRGELSGVPTGFPTIDSLTHGWQRGNMVVVAARPSIGKSAFVLNTLVAGAKAGKVGVLFSLEMSRRELEFRLLSCLSGVPLSNILGGYLSDDDFAAVAPALTEMAQLPIYLNDRSNLGTWEIRSACRRLKAERGALDLVVIDYIQLMSGSGEKRHATRTEVVTEVSRQLKVLAGELDVPILVLSQLNRSAEGRADKKPILSDLRESGALEQDADLVCFLHRAHHRQSGPTEFILEKARNASTGTVVLSIDRAVQRFTDAGMAAEQAELPPATPAPAAPKPPAFWKRSRSR